MDARLALRTAEERARALHGRADSLLRAARAEREARARAAERRERLLREGRAAEAVGAAVGRRARPARGLDRTGPPRPAPRVEQARQGREQELLAVRAPAARPRPRARRAGQLRAPRRDGPHPAADAHRAARGAGARGARPRRRRRWSPTTAPTSWCPSTRAEATEGDDDCPSPVPYVREEQQKRLRAAERALAQLGRVNPLALEEFSALEERHKFLTEQLEDLKKTRRDLLDIVREVDERVEQVFTEAYADVSRAFDSTLRAAVPRRRGPAGADRPRRHARPPASRSRPARRARRSSGSRCSPAASGRWSRWRSWSRCSRPGPSPFYILDEVEAALDDTNLGRLLEIYEELRENSQLLVITHQKRTMEVGDALYGVTMRGDGVSAVISQRLREAEPA